MGRSKRLFKKRINVCKPKNTPHNSECVATNLDESLATAMDNNYNKFETSFEQYDEFTESEHCGNEIISLSVLQDAVNKIAECKQCKGSISMCVKKRIGLASEIHISCNSCENNVDFMNTEKVSNAERNTNLYDLNIRIVYALRTIGKGRTSGRLLCSVLNLPPPPTKFSAYVDVLSSASEHVCSQEMDKAAKECISLNNDNKDLCVAFDGTWQKRGHLSHNGVVTATSVDTGKVIDIAVMSKFCRCPQRNSSIHVDACSANYSGVSGGMEVAGVREIFHRSETLYGARYVKYLGDGDSKAYKAIVSSKIYGDTQIEKLECIGHIQKRMGCRLHELKKKFSGKKLSDGKPLGGKNRLTDALILKIQKYYGLAIRRNVGSLQNLQQAVWAEYFHLLSSNENHNHGLCPVGIESWCKFQRALAKGEVYDHDKQTHISLPIMEVIKPIFRDLSNPDLLKKCLHGKTQNPNESVNSVIWSRLPKTVFVSLKILKFGVFDAVSCFNGGNIIKCYTLARVGINPGFHTLKILKQLDQERVIDRERKVSEFHKKARQRNQIAKRKLEDTLNEQEIDDPSYKSGFH